MIRDRSRSRTAFSLLEILLCSALLLVAVVPFLGFLDNLTRQTGLTRARIVARSLARAVVERYRVERLEKLAARFPDAAQGAKAIDADPLLKLPAGPLADLVRNFAFRRSVLLERTAAGDAAALRKGILTVRVDWTEDARARTYELKTLIVDGELATGRLEEVL